MVFKNRTRTEEKIVFNRLTFLALIIFILAIFIILKLFKLQVIDHNYYTALAKDQQEFFSELLPKRGEIFIQELKSGELHRLATNRLYYLMYAVPIQVSKPKQASEAISQMFEVEEEKIFKQLIKEGDVYEPLVHKVNDVQKAEIEKLDLAGIKFMEENWRFYPENNLASQVMGFVGYRGDEKVGQYGLEGYFEKDLAGIKGATNFTRDAMGRLIPVADSDFQAAEDGVDIVLTLDRSIQYVACSALGKAVLRHGATGGSVIILEPQTGAILAMCNVPDFNPNEYSEVKDISYYNNSAIFEAYEPGSIFKPITMSMAIDLGRVTPETTYEDMGEVKIAGFTITNSDKKAHGINTMTQVLEKSLNTGAIFVAQKVGNDLFEKYVENFGFGQISGINLNTEVAGNISSLGTEDVYTATASFGQGITVTPLQMVAAFGVFANDGKLMKPYIVEEKKFSNGHIEHAEPQVIRQVVSPKTALTISGMLASVVKNGHAKAAGVDGYFVAGKTGTAQVADRETGVYYANRTIHTFIGFTPLDEPRFVMLTKLNNPKDVRFAASSAAPLFREIAQFLVNYLQIPKG
jgi:cell division protein FtsI/penicillin-binding protein 2